MELLTTQTLWEGFDPAQEKLDVTVAKRLQTQDFTFKKVYFTGRVFQSGNRTRVCAKVCAPTTNTTKAILLIGHNDQIADEQLQQIAQKGFVVVAIDVDGRSQKYCGTMYPPEVSYCDAISNKDIFYFEDSAKSSKLYEQALCSMRAVTYLVEEEHAKSISVVTVGDCSILGAIVCAKDTRVTNGAFLFGSLNVDYPEQREIETGSLVDNLNLQLAYEERAHAWTMALAPQSYATNISVPIYIVNSAISAVVDIVAVDKMYYRINDKSRLLIVPNMFDCLQSYYFDSVIAWCKGVAVLEEGQLTYQEVDGEYFVQLQTTAKLKDTTLWYCVNADVRAKHWTQTKFKKKDDCFVAKLTLNQSNCNVVAFAEIGGKIVCSTCLLDIPVKNAKNVKQPTRIIFTGEGDNQLIAVSENRAWLTNDLQAKLAKGYLDIVGAEGKCLATFNLPRDVRNNVSGAISFDVCCTVATQLIVCVVADFGGTNDTYVAKTQLVGDGKWQHITVDTENFHSVVDGKFMAEDKKSDLVIFKSTEEFILNNVILV